MRRSLFLLPLLLLLGACRGVDTRVTWYFERMITQPKFKPYAENDFFADGRAMRTPPGGTVPREALLGPPLLVEGVADGTFAATIPIPLTDTVLALGQRRFDVVCAVCHGVAGDGASVVATKMQLVRPPSLLKPQFLAFSPGQLYQVVNEGYGLMPSYAPLLSLEERWAVVAYVKALQLSQHAVVAELPEPVRSEVLERLKGGKP